MNAHMHTHIHSCVCARLPATQTQIQLSRCVSIVCGCFLGSRFKLKSTYRGNFTHSLSATKLNENRNKQQQSQNEHSIDHVTHWKRYTVLLFSVLRLFYSAVSAREILSLTHSLSLCYSYCECVQFKTKTNLECFAKLEDLEKLFFFVKSDCSWKKKFRISFKRRKKESIRKKRTQLYLFTFLFWKIIFD